MSGKTKTGGGHTPLQPGEVFPSPSPYAGMRVGQDIWEHKQIELPDTYDVSQHGTDGWELVCVVRAARPDNIIAYFKRPK